MTSFSAIIPVADMNAANNALEELGYGPNNFTVPAFNSAQPGFALFHAWDDPAFRAAVELLPNVIITSGEATPAVTVTAACNEVGATWAQNALPLAGVVTPGLYYYTDGSLWYVIQQYDTAVWPDPNAPGLQALVVPARMPGVVTAWVQPINQFTAYYLVNPFTNAPDEVTHNGQVWFVSQGDGAGLNVFEPGVFGWTVKS
jgi:hypothetical protein